MKFVKAMKRISLVIIVSLCFLLTAFTQEETPTPTPDKRERVTKNSPTENPKTDGKTIEIVPEKKTVEPNQTEPARGGTPEKKDQPKQTQENTDDLEIKNAIVPYYDNYLSSYPLGPTDVISVEVFGQPNYSKAGITIPPTGTISYPLIPGGIFVHGKTTDQIAKEIAKKLDEYIIDPQVTVTLERVGSAQFAVLGKVGFPGVRLMTKRYSVYDAIVESGGLAPEADKKRITLMRRTPQGSYNSMIVKLEEMVSGKIPMEYLNPGDQIVVPEKKWSMNKILDVVSRASAFRILFGSPF
jgi:polysaccharide export outer membrane protein